MPPETILLFLQTKKYLQELGSWRYFYQSGKNQCLAFFFRFLELDIDIQFDFIAYTKRGEGIHAPL